MNEGLWPEWIYCVGFVGPFLYMYAVINTYIERHCVFQLKNCLFFYTSKRSSCLHLPEKRRQPCTSLKSPLSFIKSSIFTCILYLQ